MYTWFVATLLSIDMSPLWPKISYYAIYAAVLKMLAFFPITTPSPIYVLCHILLINQHFTNIIFWLVNNFYKVKIMFPKYSFITETLTHGMCVADSIFVLGFSTSNSPLLSLV